MTTITIDIPEDNTESVMGMLKKFNVKVRESKLSELDKLSVDDYRKHFEHNAKTKRDQLLKYL